MPGEFEPKVIPFPSKSFLEKPTLSMVTKVVKERWKHFPWGQSGLLEEVVRLCNEAKLDVAVEFFREDDFYKTSPPKIKARSASIPDAYDYRNYIVISTKDGLEKEKGIVVPRYGFALNNIKLNFDLFQSQLRKEEKVSSNNIVAFPEVERRSGGTGWKVTKHGKLKK